jgi:hypothetical protein
VEEQDDVEGRTLGLVVHARHLHPCLRRATVEVKMQQEWVSEPVP